MCACVRVCARMRARLHVNKHPGALPGTGEHCRLQRRARSGRGAVRHAVPCALRLPKHFRTMRSKPLLKSRALE